MPWFARTDGLDGALAAHRQCSLGGLSEVIRDRVPGAVDLSIRFWCPDPAMPGDTEITEGEYDDFHGSMTVQNYEAVFIPLKQARLAALQQRAQPREAAAITSLIATLAEDAAELAQCKADVADPASSVRTRRAT